MEKITTSRVIIMLYPLFLIGIGFWVWLSHGRLSSLEEELEIALKEIEANTERETVDWSSGEKRLQIQQLAEAWQNKLGTRAADVPVLIEKLSRQAGVRLSDYSSGGKEIEDGYEYETGSMRIQGTFSQIMSFVTKFEKNPDKFGKISSIAIRPARREEAEVYEVRINVLVLLGPEPEES